VLALATQILAPSGSQGGPADFSTFYEEYAERVLVFLARRCLDPEIAVDLMAETFAEAYASRRKYRGRSDGEAAAWVFAIARHQLSRWFRRGRAERSALEQLGVEVPTIEPDDHARIEELAGIDGLRDAVVEHFDRLPTGQRDALRLRVIEELDYPEVARRLAISEQTARARVSRGLRKLAAALEKENPDGVEATHD